MTRRLPAIALGAAYLATIVAANWAVATYGAVPVGLGLVAPAGVWFAGLAFTLRDLLHHTAGWRIVVAAIAAGAGLSYYVASPALALASAAAFGFSELADLAVYTPIVSGRTRTGIVDVSLPGRVVSQWTPSDCRQHAGHVLDVAAAVDLDAAYRRAMVGFGLTDDRARALVGGLARFVPGQGTSRA